MRAGGLTDALGRGPIPFSLCVSVYVGAGNGCAVAAIETSVGREAVTVGPTILSSSIFLQ